MAAIKIRPISDLRNDYASVEADVREGPVFLTKNGYGMLVTMTIEEYERLLDPLERLLDETDEYCRTHPEFRQMLRVLSVKDFLHPRPLSQSYPALTANILITASMSATTSSSTASSGT